MTWTSKATLKTYFANGNVPNYDRYVDLIDSMADMNTEAYAASPATPPDLKIDGALTVGNKLFVSDVLNGGAYGDNLNLGMLDESYSLYGAYISLRGRDLSGAPGWAEIVTHTGNAASNSGEIRLTQYDGSTWHSRLRISKTGEIYINAKLYVINTIIDDAHIEINNDGSGNRYSYIDFHGDDTYTDYGFRIIRFNTGQNANTSLLHRGTGTLYLATQDAGPIILQTNGYTRMTVDSNGRVAFGPNSPSTDFNVDIQGRLGVEDFTGRLLTSSTSSGYSNHWTKIASIDFTTQYSYGYSHIKLTGGATTNNPRFGEVYFNVKQQAALGSPPVVTLYLYDNVNLGASNVVAVTTVNNFEETRVDLYVKIGITYETLRLLPLNSYKCDIYGSQPFISTLPSGTQTTATQI